MKFDIEQFIDLVNEFTLHGLIMKFDVEQFIDLVNEFTLHRIHEFNSEETDYSESNKPWHYLRKIFTEACITYDDDKKINHHIHQDSNEYIYLDKTFFTFQIYKIIYLQNILMNALDRYSVIKQYDCMTQISSLTIKEVQDMTILSDLQEKKFNTYISDNMGDGNQEDMDLQPKFYNAFMKYLENRYGSDCNFFHAIRIDYEIKTYRLENNSKATEEDFIINVSSLCHLFKENYSPAPYSMLFDQYIAGNFSLDPSPIMKKQIQYLSSRYSHLSNDQRKKLKNILKIRLETIKDQKVDNDEKYLQSIAEIISASKPSDGDIPYIKSELKNIINIFERSTIEFDFSYLKHLIKTKKIFCDQDQTQYIEISQTMNIIILYLMEKDRSNQLFISEMIELKNLYFNIQIKNVDIIDYIFSHEVFSKIFKFQEYFDKNSTEPEHQEDYHENNSDLFAYYLHFNYINLRLNMMMEIMYKYHANVDEYAGYEKFDYKMLCKKFKKFFNIVLPPCFEIDNEPSSTIYDSSIFSPLCFEID